MWEVVVLDAIIRGAIMPESGSWRAEIVVETLRRIRADTELSATLEAASDDESIARFLEVYEATLAESQ